MIDFVLYGKLYRLSILYLKQPKKASLWASILYALRGQYSAYEVGFVWSEY